jgi:hypothetical protein
MLKKKVTFEDCERTGMTIQEADVRKLERKLVRAIEENKALKLRLNEQNYTYTYKENQIMKAELRNMYILQEENKDLKEELQIYKSITHDERMKVLKEENESMKIRIGQLLDKIRTLENRTNDIEFKQTKKELTQIPLASSVFERPQTAHTRSNQGFEPLISQVEDELDLDIQKMLERNKKQLEELRVDMEEMKNQRPPPRKKI